jgi:hypothetical protein
MPHNQYGIPYQITRLGQASYLTKNSTSSGVYLGPNIDRKYTRRAQSNPYSSSKALCSRRLDMEEMSRLDQRCAAISPFDRTRGLDDFLRVTKHRYQA